MKKKFALLCSLLIISTCLIPIYSFAHPGRTDGYGGHFNRSTGEYHYHHGYSAHDHWDIDGDGVIDCPYKFDNKTEQNTGQTSINSDSSNSVSQSNTSITQKEEETKVPTLVYWVVGILVFVLICMFQIIRGKNETIEQNARAFRSREKDEEARVKEGLATLHKALVEKYGKDYLYAISGAPEGDYLDEDYLPHSEKDLSIDFWDQYTFYLGGHWQGSDVKYHHSSCRYAKYSYPVNAMYLKDRRRYRPCTLCPCGLPDVSWVERYKKHNEFLKKYIDTK